MKLNTYEEVVKEATIQSAIVFTFEEIKFRSLTTQNHLPQCFTAPTVMC